MKIVIVRGLPGSGKSTLAELLQKCTVHKVPCNSMVFASDDFFMVDDEYKFDRDKLPLAHRECRSRVLEAIQSSANGVGCPDLTIVVANTNTCTEEIAFYHDLATIYTDNVEILEIGPPPGVEEKEWVDLCTERNVHGVPKQSIKGMAFRMKSKLPNWYNLVKVSRHNGSFIINREGGQETVMVPSFQTQE